jgi:hypothetical protein
MMWASHLHLLPYYIRGVYSDLLVYIAWKCLFIESQGYQEGTIEVESSEEASLVSILVNLGYAFVWVIQELMWSIW